MTINDVATEIRRQLGLHNAAPFNLKYIDIEGKYNQSIIIYIGYIVDTAVEHC